MAARTSCGVLVTDGARLLLGHATRSPRWDIPKGLAEPGEDHRAAAVRELREETGLLVAPEALVPLGVRPYLPGKDLALFRWQPETLPDPAALHCRSLVTLRGGGVMPELDRFGLFGWEDAMARVGRAMEAALAAVRTG